MKNITLNDGARIPAIGFGTFRIPADGSTYRAVRKAIDVGYRHVDTALMYGNEAEVGRAIRDSGVPRGDLFVTSKLWLSHYGYDRAQVGCERSLRNLGLDYIDLYLLHQPYGDLVGAWRALEEAKAAGRIRSLGVSNMTVNLWNRYVPEFDTVPSVNQVECHPLAQQRAIRDFLAPKGVRVECWGPLAQGRTALLTHPVVAAVAEAHGKDVGQVILRFELQEGLIVLPKSVHPQRIRSNFEVFDFSLSDAEMSAIRALDRNAVMRDPETPGVGEMLLAKYPLD